LVPAENVGGEALARRVHTEQVPHTEQLSLSPRVPLHRQEVPSNTKIEYKCCGSGYEMGKKSESGSGINNPDHISESFETIFPVKILKFF
jgi:hypothetical protein